MGLFGKKKQEAAPAQGGQTSDIQVLGSGCAKCCALEDAVKAALVELGQEPVVEHVTDFVRIAAMGVMTTPALVVDGKVVSCGQVLSKEEAKHLIQEARKLS